MSRLFRIAVASGLCLTAHGAYAEDPGERFQEMFNALNRDTLHLLDELYAEDVVFTDPLGELQGLDALRAYYTDLYGRTREVRFDFHSAISDGERFVYEWTMYFATDKMKEGRERTLAGVSVVRFREDGKVIQHRDYFDMGEFVYEHVPVVRMAVKKIKKRLQHVPDEGGK